MPVTVDSKVHENTGVSATAGTSVVVSLAGTDTTAAGNTVLVQLVAYAPAISAPAGFVQDKKVDRSAAAEAVMWYRKSNVGAGESSWTFTLSGAVNWAWRVAEYADLDLDPVDTSAAGTPSTSMTDGATVSTGTTGANAGLNTLLIAAWGLYSPTVGANLGSWSGQTNGLTEVVELTGNAAGVASLGLTVADRVVDAATGPFESSATWATGGAVSTTGWAGMVAYRAADSPVVSPLVWMSGLEHGTHNGLGSNLLGGSPLMIAIGTVGTDLIVQSGSARSPSVYGCRVVQAGAAKYLAIDINQFGSGRGGAVLGWNVRTVSSTGIVVLAEVMAATGTALQVVYDTTATKLGLRWGSGGTPSWQPGTTAANAWAWITLRVTGMTGTVWHADWTLETGTGVYTAQTSPADLTGQTATSLGQVRWGGNVAQTVTQDVDDLVCSTFGGSYPLGPHALRGLTVDPAGTPTFSGTVGNFALVTSNATGAALTAGTLTNARDNIDELPPTISASSDGVVQTATAASDYLQFPMNTYTAGPSEYIAAVRMLACLISTTGAGAGSLGIRGWDGTTETTLMGTGFTSTPGSSTTPSSSVPPWVGYMWAPTNGWTQAKLDAAALRLGFSTDATPDMGVHAMYLEVAVGTARTQQLFGDLASSTVDPNRRGTVAVTVVAPAGYDTTLHYEESGTPTDVPVTGGASVTEQINATFEADVNYIAAYPAAEPDPVD